MTTPDLMMPYTHYFEPVQGQIPMKIPLKYQTSLSANPETALLLPEGAQMLMLSWSGPEEIYVNMTNFWTSVGARLFRAGTIPAGSRGTPRSIIVKANSPERQYIYAYVSAGASAATVADRFMLEVMVYPLA